MIDDSGFSRVVTLNSQNCAQFDGLNINQCREWRSNSKLLFYLKKIPDWKNKYNQVLPPPPPLGLTNLPPPSPLDKTAPRPPSAALPPPVLPPWQNHKFNQNPGPPNLHSYARHKQKTLNQGKKIGILFMVIATILQIGVVGFLIFKRRQLLKLKDTF